MQNAAEKSSTLTHIFYHFLFNSSIGFLQFGNIFLLIYYVQYGIIYLSETPIKGIKFIGGIFMSSTKSWIVTLLLCIFLGELGIHRFYAGKVGTGLLYLFTGGLFGIGWILDIIWIVLKKFTDNNGYFIAD